MTASVPRTIEETTTRYLESVDNGPPGLVEGLYVVGSAALGAWQPGASDIDTIILTSRPLTAEDRPALEKVHAGMLPAPHLDGVYLDPGLLRYFPDTRQVTPFVVDGQLKFDKPCGELNPVLWLTLQRHGRRLRGPAIAHRAGAPQQFTFADLRAAAASVHAVADDAWTRFG